MKFKFLHVADLHLGFQIRGLDRTKYCKRAILKAINIVRDNNLDALIISGDLFENDKIYREDIEFLNETFELIHPKPVVISPGNHDFLNFNCAYDQRFLNILRIKDWSENVKIFKIPEFSNFSFGDINIYGKPCLNRQAKAFDKPINIEPSKINIAVIHASRINFSPQGKEIWNPFEDKDILNSNFDYVALGHYHNYSEISDGSVIKSAYPGSMVPVSIAEYGKRGGLIVEIIKKDNKISTEVEFVELSDFSIKKIEVSPSQNIEKIKNVILSEISDSNNPKDSLFILKIKGMGDLSIMYLKELFSEYKILFDTSEFTKFDMEKLKETSPETTMGTFINEMLKLIENADGREKQILEDALIYGLDAFAGKQITPRFYDEN
ncbi:MAG: DNA repair exonuclease [Thermodesulfovibrio sp.]|nr:DNA repair exonuclease [Thermodesulfovibrio sp.]MDW7997984.1 DNA repair exonuclease [Thermodesulfovibrio sp.]